MSFVSSTFHSIATVALSAAVALGFSHPTPPPGMGMEGGHQQNGEMHDSNPGLGGQQGDGGMGDWRHASGTLAGPGSDWRNGSGTPPWMSSTSDMRGPGMDDLRIGSGGPYMGSSTGHMRRRISSTTISHMRAAVEKHLAEVGMMSSTSSSTLPANTQSGKPAAGEAGQSGSGQGGGFLNFVRHFLFR